MEERETCLQKKLLNLLVLSLDISQKKISVKIDIKGTSVSESERALNRDERITIAAFLSSSKHIRWKELCIPSVVCLRVLAACVGTLSWSNSVLTNWIHTIRLKHYTTATMWVSTLALTHPNMVRVFSEQATNGVYLISVPMFSRCTSKPYTSICIWMVLCTCVWYVFVPYAQLATAGWR